jgi:ribosome-associated translation inhibitor RaiA
MQISIQAQGFRMTPALSEHVKRRLSFALSRSSEQIQRINVWLADVNGPRGGIDKCCRLEVRLPRQGSLMVEQFDSDMYAAISRSAATAGRRVTGQLKRSKLFKRGRKADLLPVDNEALLSE